MENTTNEVKVEKKRKNRPAKLGQYKCAYCGGLGHNKRKCPKRLADEKNNSTS